MYLSACYFSSEESVTLKRSWPEMCENDSSSNSFKVSNTQLQSKTLCDHQCNLTTKTLRRLAHLYHRNGKLINYIISDWPTPDLCCSVNQLVILKCGGFTGNVTYFCFTVWEWASLRYCVVCWYSLIEYNEAAVQHWPLAHYSFLATAHSAKRWRLQLTQ